MADRTPGPAWLFCPADRPDRYPKALAAADVVILDLEDAVAPAHKDVARAALRTLAAAGELDADRTVLRLNGASTTDHGEDLKLLARLPLDWVMLAKAEQPQQVSAIDASYRDIARYGRSKVLSAAKAHERLTLDAVHMDIDDNEGLAAECADAVAVGFDATAAIHPRQVEVISSAYRPTPAQVDWARRLLAHVGADRGVTTFEGRMVDGPIFQQAERMLRLAAAPGGA